MVSIKLKFRASSMADKAGSLYYQVIYDRVIRHVPMPYRIYPEEWDPNREELVIKPLLLRSNYLESVRQTVQCDTLRMMSVFRELSSHIPSLTADMLVAEFQRQTSGHSFFRYIDRIAAQYLRQGQSRTSETYATTLSSFRKFRGEVDINLEDVNSELMESYERFLRRHSLSPNTISFYMKHLRAAYNRAVDAELVTDRRPFRHVTTSIERTVKRAVSLRLIKRLKSLSLHEHPARCFARDMFLFSFYTRGMSFVDIAFLQKKNLKGNILYYRRKKTNQLLMIHWEPCMQEIVDRYKSDASSPYLLSIIRNPDTNARQQYQNAMSRVNRHLKQIGQELGLHQPLTMYCARHSWASIARDEGIPLAVISEGMGHDSEKTTQIYLSSLNTEVIDNANRKILNLL